MFIKNSARKAFKLQIAEDFLQTFLVGFLDSKLFEIQLHGNVGLDGGEKFGQRNFLAVVLHLLLYCTFELVGGGEQVVDAAKLVYQFHGGLFAHAGTARNVVGRVAHESEQVDHLFRFGNSVFRSHLLFAPNVVARATETGTIHIDVGSDELPIVFVGGEHVGLYASQTSLCGQRTNHVVGLKAVGLKHRYAEGVEYVLYYWYRSLYVFRASLALCLIFGVGRVAESGSAGVESHADMRWFLLFQHLVERVDKAHYGRCVLSFRVDSRVFDERIVGAVYQCVCVQKEEFVHI